MKYVDIHGHVHFKAYDVDRVDVISRCIENQVGVINVGTDFESSVSAVELAKQNENMWAIIGLHPVHTGCSYNDPAETGIKDEGMSDIKSYQNFDATKFSELAKEKKVVAIGECGLDYFHSEPEDMKKQREEFEKQIIFANEINKPLMLHIRNAKNGNSAYAEAVQILETHANVRANFHFFAGTTEDLKKILDIGGTVSFTGVITFTSNYDDLVRYVPMDRVMSETDCPYVSPTPYRGKRNEPSYVVEVVKSIARIRNADVESVSSALLANAKDFFSLENS